MDKFRKFLKEIGLTEEELQVYLYLLQNDKNTILSIARVTDIPRTTVYLIVDSLIKQGLISEKNIDQKKYLVSETPEIILKKLQEKKNVLTEAVYEIRDALPELMATFNLHNSKPSISYFEGSENIFKIIKKGLSTDKIYIFAPSGNFHDAFSNQLEEFYRSIDEDFIYTKEIYLSTEKSRIRIDSPKSIRNQTQFLPDIFKSPVDTVLFDGLVLYVYYKNAEVYGILSINKDAEVSEKMKFIMIWQYLSQNKEI